MKTLILDIETAPGERYYWDLFEDHAGIDQIIRPPRLLCFAAKWHKQKQVEFLSEWGDGHDAMIQAAASLMDEADAIVHYYGKRFDVPHLNWAMAVDGIPPPAPHKDIDLKDTVKRRFKPSSMKLDFVAQSLGIGKKVEHEGFMLWRKIIDPLIDERTRAKAQRDMQRYNIHDIVLEEKVYDYLLPWIPNHPNVALYDGIENGCSTCGSTDLVKNGFKYTSVGKFQRFRCRNCGAPVASGKRIEGVDLRPS